MFKHKHVGSAHAFKKEVDWGAVFGVAFWVIIGLVILANL